MLDTYRTMPFDELASLHENLTVILNEKRVEEEDKLRRHIHERADKLGIAIESLFTPQKEVRAPARIKYRNPENSEETWTGKGKMPTWILQALETTERKDRTDYLIES